MLLYDNCDTALNRRSIFIYLSSLILCERGQKNETGNNRNDLLAGGKINSVTLGTIGPSTKLPVPTPRLLSFPEMFSMNQVNLNRG